MPAIHVLVKGKVQGVFFRVTAKEVADELALKGWVKNTDEGDVEIVASGEQPQLDKFVDWCRTGPRRAHVDSVTVKELPEQAFTEFAVVRG